MAALPLPPSSTVQTSRRSREGRARPNLSKICSKTKMCSYHLRGMCKRAEACTFAHDQNEIQDKPDLGCTKLCPVFLSEGHCPEMNRCKFAHSIAELRKIDVDELDTPSSAVSSGACAPSRGDEQEMTNSAGSKEQVLPQTGGQVECRLNDATVSGPLTLGGMVFHLTRIFLALYEARPEVADRVGVPADVLAVTTAEETWADAGLDRTSMLSFKDFTRLCALPLTLMPREVSPPAPLAFSTSKVPQQHLHIGKIAAHADWESCSTDDSRSDVSIRASSGWQTPPSCDDLEDEWCEPEMKIMNTFIHFSTPSIATRTKRAQSVPSRLGRAA